jgi:condensin complex subunit 3
VELLCANWLKSAKFDPISLLDNLNPVLNETVCELATEVFINVASKIDCDSSDDDGVELVRKHFGGPEIRSFQQQVLKKRCITPTTDGESDVSPSLAFFLRVKCNSATNKMEMISDVIGDIPTLCSMLNSHVDKLIEFNKEDSDEMDDEEKEAYEDEQNFICLQLIHMAKTSELQEEGSRRHFISIMRSMLSRLATPDELVDACVKTMALAHDTEAHFLQTISEILVDIEEDHSTDHDEKAIVVVRQMRIISILSFVLENIGGKMVGNPILTSTLQHLLPAVTSKNAIIREHGVICLSKFCLLSEEDRIMDEFKPLLMQIAGSVEERVEVRAQAMLALCDLSLLHKNMLPLSDDESGDNESTTFKELLLEMLGHSKQGISVIAAEVAAKMLLAGCFHDSTIIAWLLVIYFDATLTNAEDDDSDIDGSEVKKVGSPVRLQQLLSIFFPTYSMSSLDANDAIMASVGPLLTIVNGKLEGKKQAKALTQWPIAKMVEYICYNVDLADKTKKEENSDGDTVQVDKVEAAGQVNDEIEGDQQEGGSDDNTVNEKETGDDAAVVEASSTLLASIDIAEFLAEEGTSAPTYYNRALAKMLGSASIDVEAEDSVLLSRLKSQVAEAEYSTDDGPTVNQIKKLLTILADVADEDERSYASEDTSGEGGEEDEQELEDELDEDSVPETTDKEDLSVDESFATATFEENIEKENSRLSMSSMKSSRLSMSSMKSAKEYETETEQTPSKRVSLGAVNNN